MSGEIAGILTRHTDWKYPAHNKAACVCGRQIFKQDGEVNWYPAQRRHQELLIRNHMRQEQTEENALLRLQLDGTRKALREANAEIARLLNDQEGRR